MTNLHYVKKLSVNQQIQKRHVELEDSVNLRELVYHHKHRNPSVRKGYKPGMVSRFNRPTNADRNRYEFWVSDNTFYRTFGVSDWGDRRFMRHNATGWNNVDIRLEEDLK